jgi:hypothetical protein
MHGGREIDLLKLNKQVVVVGHETVGENLCGITLDEVFSDKSQEMERVFSLEEDSLAIHASVVDMVVTARDKGDLAAGHGLD